MAPFPLFPERPPKTMEEVAQQVHDSRLLGLALLLAGSILVGAGLPNLWAGEALEENGLLLAGAVQAFVGLLLIAAVPPLLVRRWRRRLRQF